MQAVDPTAHIKHSTLHLSSIFTLWTIHTLQARRGAKSRQTPKEEIQKSIEARSSQMQKSNKARKQPGVNQEDGPPLRTPKMGLDKTFLITFVLQQ